MYSVQECKERPKMEIAGRNYSSAGHLCALLIRFSNYLTWQSEPPETLFSLWKQRTTPQKQGGYGSPKPHLLGPDVNNREQTFSLKLFLFLIQVTKGPQSKRFKLEGLGAYGTFYSLNHIPYSPSKSP